MGGGMAMEWTGGDRNATVMQRLGVSACYSTLKGDIGRFEDEVKCSVWFVRVLREQVVQGQKVVVHSCPVVHVKSAATVETPDREWLHCQTARLISCT